MQLDYCLVVSSLCPSCIYTSHVQALEEGRYLLYIFFYPTYKPFLLVNESGNIIFIYEWSCMWWSGVVFVVNVWCELWAWWTWGHLPNCHNLLSLIDFQLSLKSSKQSTSDLTTTPTPTQSSHLSSFLQRIFPQQLIDIYWLAGWAGQSSPRRPGQALLLYEMYTSRVKNNFNEIIINIPSLIWPCHSHHTLFAPAYSWPAPASCCWTVQYII